MNWKSYVANDLNLLDKTTKFTFNLPASNSLLTNLKETFSLSELPNDLEELYRQTDGIGEVLEGHGKTGDLIWPIKRVIETNNECRNYPEFKGLYMSFEQILFISDAGNGDLFGYVTLNGKFDRNDIFVWNHEDDSRTWVAPNLTKFIEWWSSGKISV